MLMEILVWILLIAGIVGAILPILPGPLLTSLALLLHVIFEAPAEPGRYYALMILGVLFFLLDFFLPGLIARKGGGSKYGARGANIGLFLGILFLPGIVLGVILGAFIGEYFFAKQDSTKSVKSALLASLGVLAGIFTKLIFTIYVVIYFAFSL